MTLSQILDLFQGANEEGGRRQGGSLTLSAMGGAGPSIAWGGQFDPHFLTAPGGLLGHKSFNTLYCLRRG